MEMLTKVGNNIDGGCTILKLNNMVKEFWKSDKDFESKVDLNDLSVKFCGRQSQYRVQKTTRKYIQCPRAVLLLKVTSSICGAVM